jgi:hypothetical protein
MIFLAYKGRRITPSELKRLFEDKEGCPFKEVDLAEAKGAGLSGIATLSLEVLVMKEGQSIAFTVEESRNSASSR